MTTADSFSAYEFTPSSYLRALSVYLQGWNRNGTRKPFARVNTFGPPGVGKTEMHVQLAKRWKRRLVTLHLSQKSPHDIQGIPVVGKDGTIQWFTTSYFPQQEIHRGVTGSVKYTLKFKYAEHLIVRIVDEQTGEEVGVFGDGQRYDLGLSDLNLINASVHINSNLVNIDLAPTDHTYTIFIEDACMFFLDDLTAASKSTTKAALQLLNDYRVGEYDVPFSCPLMGASNHEGHSSYIEPMSAAVANRLIHIHLKASIKDSLAHWIAIGVHPYLIGFFLYQQNQPTGEQLLYLFDKASMRNGRLGWRSPRAWERMAEQLQACLDEDTRIKQEPTYTSSTTLCTPSMIVGAVGEEGARAFNNYLALFAQMPNVDDILSGKIIQMDPALKNDPAYQSGVAVILAGAMKRYYDDLYLEGEDFVDQDQKWQDAVKYLFKFTGAEMRKEMGSMLFHMLNHAYEVPIVSFRATPPLPEVETWLTKYLPLARRVAKGKI